MSIRYGCQTYTWQMSYERYRDKLPSILDTIRDAGFRGVEAEICMLGGFRDDPSLLAEALRERGLELAALTLALPWQQPRETGDERAEADRVIGYLKSFPDAKLVLVQLPGRDRANLGTRQAAGLNCVNAVAERAAAEGIVSAFHPNSPPGSVFKTDEDYRIVFDGLDYRYVGYCPDSGHIASGGMDPAAIFRSRLADIRHVHFKDISADSKWRTMGEGIIDHPGLMRMLRSGGYEGWIMVEEESEFAEASPAEATLQNGRYVRAELAP